MLQNFHKLEWKQGRYEPLKQDCIEALLISKWTLPFQNEALITSGSKQTID